jgi:hypothetical protein
MKTIKNGNYKEKLRNMKTERELLKYPDNESKEEKKDK